MGKKVTVGMGILTSLLLNLLTPAARAGSITADSIWSAEDARQQALQGVPRDAQIGETRCIELDVARSTRYRCTVFFNTAPPQVGIPSKAQADPANSSP